MRQWLNTFLRADAFKKRGIIYISIAALMLLYELIFSRPIRPTVVLLWIGVLLIAFLVMTQLKDPNR